MKYYVTVEGTTRVVELRDGRAWLDGEPVAADLASLPGTDRLHLRLDGRSVPLFGRRAAEEWLVEIEGRAFRVRVEDERGRQIRQLASATAAGPTRREVRAPMPGLIVKVEVGAGDEVEEGDGLVVMEAMKMQNELRADLAARVTEVRAVAGRTVNRDDLLIVLESTPADEVEGA
ncbi:MAG: biotin/lipoyl-containing protein [Gemmatimonadota bacterium]|jgi:biotin carboxyl carrier protein